MNRVEIYSENDLEEHIYPRGKASVIRIDPDGVIGPMHYVMTVCQQYLLLWAALRKEIETLKISDNGGAATACGWWRSFLTASRMDDYWAVGNAVKDLHVRYE